VTAGRVWSGPAGNITFWTDTQGATSETRRHTCDQLVRLNKAWTSTGQMCRRSYDVSLPARSEVDGNRMWLGGRSRFRRSFVEAATFVHVVSTE